MALRQRRQCSSPPAVSYSLQITLARAANSGCVNMGAGFSCYKVRADIGANKPMRKTGTDKAVQLLARAAYASQRETAKDDIASASTPGGQARRRHTVLGVDCLKL